MKWYKETKYVHIPNSLPAYIISVVAIVFLISVFLFFDEHSRSASQTIYTIFPHIVATFLLIEWFASKKDRCIIVATGNTVVTTTNSLF